MVHQFISSLTSAYTMDTVKSNWTTGIVGIGIL